LTEPLFFDTDCISAFLWVDNECILTKLFHGRIVIPKEVYDELSSPSVNRIKGLKAHVDMLVSSGEAIVKSMETGTDVYSLYRMLTGIPDNGQKIIGKGEAAAIAHTKFSNGILASNNLRDVSYYVKKYNITHYTTGEIMKLALDKSIITEAQGNDIWANMLAKRRRLGFDSFSEYLLSLP